jgi:Ca2+-binding RTX toxin-like protein
VQSLVVDGATGPVVTKAGTRVALAGGASIQWRADGVFAVRGTSGDDVIRVGRSGTGKNTTVLVKVNNVTRAFRVGGAAIRRVDIDAGDGDDAVLLGGSDIGGSVFTGQLDIAATIAGGRGNDTLVGGAKADVIHGGAGQDSISGNGGNDLLYGDAGVDTLTGGTGRDRAAGAKGSDLISEVESAT